MSLLCSISKWSEHLYSCSRTGFHTSSKNLKWPAVLRPAFFRENRKYKLIKIWENMTIWDLAKSMKKDLDYIEVIKQELGGGYGGSDGKIHDFHKLRAFLNKENAKFIVINHSSSTQNVQVQKEKKIKLSPAEKVINKESEVKRPPIVTIMGHVDHGKTTLLDALRNSNIVDLEFGGITQHIGAFSVSLKPGNSVTFIDTPGHAAFSAMRNRGAVVTDIVVLIVAADDGVMEQTVESIKMAKNAGVNILVAVNKIDKAPSDNLMKIKNQLLSEGVQAEDLGGTVQVIPISALKRKNLDKLIEALLLEAEFMALTGDPKGPFEGVILESFVGKTGKLATVIVKRGTLRKRMVLLAGDAIAKVRTIHDENGVELAEVTLSQPAQVSGWRDLPNAGDKVIEVIKERDARQVIRSQKQEELERKRMKDNAAIQEKSVRESFQFHERKKLIKELKKSGDIEGLKKAFMKTAVHETEICKLDIIVKGDVDGSVDAILNIINTYNCHDLCKLSVVQYGVGNINETDIDLAESFDAIIFCFNVHFPESLKPLIIEKQIKVISNNVIYKLIDDLKEEINSILPPREVITVKGVAEVLQEFKINQKKKNMSVAGSVCVMGEIRKDLLFKIERNNNVIYDGKLISLKHFKNEVNLIKKGTQCGIMLEDFEDVFQPGDKIICYEKHLESYPIPWDSGF